jgi:DNA repair photolyase
MNSQDAKTSSDLIIRKTLLYKTGVEYGDYTANHVQGCSHGCLYPCYAYLMARRFGRSSSYEEWCRPKLVGNAIALLDKELPVLRSSIQSVHLCFTTDPFMVGYPAISDMSLAMIQRINEEGIPCTTLTKGLYPPEIASTSNINQYGITLISLDENFRERCEPGASSYAARIESLRRLSEKGFKTWVSIEPYPTPNIVDQDIGELLESIRFTHRIVFGRLNYNKLVTEYKGFQSFFDDLARTVRKFCDQNGIDLHIKRGTATFT